MQRVGATLLQFLTGSDEDGSILHLEGQTCEGMFLEKYSWIDYPIDTSAKINLTRSWFLGSSAKTCQLECWTMDNYLVKEI